MLSSRHGRKKQADRRQRKKGHSRRPVLVHWWGRPARRERRRLDKLVLNRPGYVVIVNSASVAFVAEAKLAAHNCSTEVKLSKYGGTKKLLRAD